MRPLLTTLIVLLWLLMAYIVGRIGDDMLRYSDKEVYPKGSYKLDIVGNKVEFKLFGEEVKK